MQYKGLKGLSSIVTRTNSMLPAKTRALVKKRIPGRKALAADVKAVGMPKKMKRCANWQR